MSALEELTGQSLALYELAGLVGNVHEVVESAREVVGSVREVVGNAHEVEVSVAYYRAVQDVDVPNVLVVKSDVRYYQMFYRMSAQSREWGKESDGANY